MSDTTKCYGKNLDNICPIREKCWRFICPPGTMQGYFINMPYDHNTKECDCFLHREEVKQNEGQDDGQRDNRSISHSAIRKT